MEKRYKKVNKVEVFEEGDPVFPSGHTVPGMTLIGPGGVISVWCRAVYHCAAFITISIGIADAGRSGFRFQSWAGLQCCQINPNMGRSCHCSECMVITTSSMQILFKTE
jgi:hypothetical protein